MNASERTAGVPPAGSTASRRRVGIRNVWTGGQYSMFRVVFGLYLLVHFVMLAFANAALPLVVLAALASILFILGWHDRVAAMLMACVLAYLVTLAPSIAKPPLLVACALLLAHACLPPAPFCSLAARGRVDPRGGWSMPPAIFAAAWAVTSLGYAYSGSTRLASTPNLATSFAGALELLYAPLAFFRRTRPWIWTAMLAMHLGLMVLIDFADLSFMMIVLHFFTFDPAWIPRRAPGTVDQVLYDGTCGLCHRSVRLLLAEDTANAFVFAPLGDEDFGADSMVVKTADGRVLMRSDAVVHLLQRLGGFWRVFGGVFGLVPRRLRDAWYDFVARVRYRIFGRTKDACPLMPPDLRSRFDVR